MTYLKKLLPLTILSMISIPTIEGLNFHVKQYQLLDHKQFPTNPLMAYMEWMPQAKNRYATLATVDNSKPDMRIIRIRDVTPDRLVFYTNPNSNKVKQIRANKHVALLVVNSMKNGDIRVAKFKGWAMPVDKIESHSVTIDGETHKVLWRPYIVKLTYADFTERSQHDGVGVVQYVLYNKIKKGWSKKTGMKYLTPSSEGAPE